MYFIKDGWTAYDLSKLEQKADHVVTRVCINTLDKPFIQNLNWVLVQNTRSLCLNFFFFLNQTQEKNLWRLREPVFLHGCRQGELVLRPGTWSQSSGKLHVAFKRGRGLQWSFECEKENKRKRKEKILSSYFCQMVSLGFIMLWRMVNVCYVEQISNYQPCTNFSASLEGGVVCNGGTENL